MRQVLYKGKIWEVTQEIDSVTKSVHEYVRRPPGVRLIILTPQQTLLLTKEFRTEHKNIDIRLPGGKVFDSLKEYYEALQTYKNIMPQIEQAAKKEAREEVGIDITEMKYLTTSRNGATVEWDLFYFVVENYTSLPKGQHLEKGENIEVIEISLEQAKKMCLQRDIQEDRSVAVLLRFLLLQSEEMVR